MQSDTNPQVHTLHVITSNYEDRNLHIFQLYFGLLSLQFLARKRRLKIPHNDRIKKD